MREQTKKPRKTEKWIKVQRIGLKDVKTRIGDRFMKALIKKPFYVSERNKFFDYYKKSSEFKVIKEFEKVKK